MVNYDVDFGSGTPTLFSAPHFISLFKSISKRLIDFAKNVKPAAFHPFTLRLVRENLPQWTNPLVGKSDYKLFLEGVFDSTRISDMEQMIDQAIRDDRVFFFNERLGDWDLHSF